LCSLFYGYNGDVSVSNSSQSCLDLILDVLARLMS